MQHTSFECSLPAKFEVQLIQVNSNNNLMNKLISLSFFFALFLTNLQVASFHMNQMETLLLLRKKK